MKKDYHISQTPLITVEEAWQDKSILWVDVRSEGEFEAGSVPSSVNIALLDNVERKQIGILYKELGQENAISTGYEILEKKFVEFVESFIPLKNRACVVICARGGMRSRVVTNLLLSNGFQVKQVQGGYKAFRSWTIKKLEEIQLPYPLVVLHGKTGIGKTILINSLPNSIDLEGLAQHRSSKFGAIGKKPSTQKNFEINLLCAIEQVDSNQPIIVEGESRKIGNRISIPNSFFHLMQVGEFLLVDCSLDTRVKRTIEDYVDAAGGKPEDFKAAIEQIKMIGKAKRQELYDLLDQEDYYRCFEYLLTHVYDLGYGHTMKKYQFYGKTISSENIQEAVEEIIQLTKQIGLDYDSRRNNSSLPPTS